ncbi:MAG: hypothetical protein KDC98_16135, partial [Planctomycetes bacterium]|nr:hypothetical protein [Planctomycetota bacterium]
IFISRFIAGIRVVTYFTAGTMKTSWLRFILTDLCGIVLIVPLFVWIGAHFGGTIDQAIAFVKSAERRILITAAVVGSVLGLWYWLRRRRRRQALVGTSVEAFVEPSSPVRRDGQNAVERGLESESESPSEAAPIDPSSDRSQ